MQNVLIVYIFNLRMCLGPFYYVTVDNMYVCANLLCICEMKNYKRINRNNVGGLCGCVSGVC